MTDYEEKAREKLRREQQDRLDMIRELDIELGNLYEQMFRIKMVITAIEGKREALKDIYKSAHPYLGKDGM